ncbi:MAG: hypothetical protein ACRELY_28365, partial [Polyangiaceae bacterium]
MRRLSVIASTLAVVLFGCSSSSNDAAPSPGGSGEDAGAGTPSIAFFDLDDPSGAPTISTLWT